MREAGTGTLFNYIAAAGLILITTISCTNNTQDITCEKCKSEYDDIQCGWYPECGADFLGEEAIILPEPSNLSPMDVKGISVPGIDYWELRFFQGNDSEERGHLVFSVGELCEGDYAREPCIAEYDKLRPEEPSASLCSPGLCYYYIIAIKEGKPVQIGNVGEFFAPIDSPAEIAILLASHGYRWHCQTENKSPDRNCWGYKSNADHWEVAACFRVSSCGPMVIERRKLSIDKDGSIDILECHPCNIECHTCS